MDNTDKELIVAAAIKLDNDLYGGDLIISSPPPARHYTIMHPISKQLGIKIGPESQGFLTSTGRFVSREEALKLVLKSDQKLIDHQSRNEKYLFSEDLW